MVEQAHRHMTGPETVTAPVDGLHGTPPSVTVATRRPSPALAVTVKVKVCGAGGEQKTGSSRAVLPTTGRPATIERRLAIAAPASGCGGGPSMMLCRR